MNNYIKLNFKDIVFAIILYFLTGFISTVFYLPAYLFNLNTYIFAPAVSIANYTFFFIIFYFIILKPRNQVYKTSYRLKNFSLFPIALMLFAGQFIISEFFISSIPTTGPFWGKLYNYMNQALTGNLTSYPIQTFLLIAIIAPICEELFFRGFILKGLLNNNVKPVYAIIISALIFGGIHIFPWQAIGGISAGLILGLTFYKTGSLLTCTLLHFLNNFIGYLLLLKNGSLENPDYLENDSYYILPIGILLVIICGFFYLKITKNNIWKSY